MHLEAVVADVEGGVGHVQEVVGEVLLDQIALVAAADHELPHAVRGEYFHDVPQDGPAADFDQRFRAKMTFFADAGAQPTRQNHCLHGVCLFPGLIARMRLIPSSSVMRGFQPGTGSPRRGLILRDGAAALSLVICRLRPARRSKRFTNSSAVMSSPEL